jgi:iron complex transport system substrate-binding protein
VTRPARPLALAALAIAAIALPACGDDDPAPSAAAGATTTTASAGGRVDLDNCGVRLRREAAPERAVAISQPAIELLLTLGRADRMVGAAGWNDPVVPALRTANAKVPQLGKEFPSFERTLRTEPDFVYTTFAWGFSDEGTAPRERFAKLGVDTYLSRSECGGQDARQTSRLRFEDVFREVRELAAIFGVERRGAQVVAGLQRRLATATSGLDARGVDVAWWYAATKAPYIAGCCGAPGMITERVGATNAFASAKQLWPEVSWEAILERDPDVLVLADLTRGGDGDSARAKLAFLRSNPVAKRLTAVRENRFIVMTGSDMDPSLRNVGAVEKLAAGIRKLGLERG